MEKYIREYPWLSLCGLNCGLCPNYYSAGASRCGGCGSEAFFNPSCSIVSCSRRHGGVEFCTECEEYPCPKYDGADAYDSFITHRNQLRDFEKLRRIGLPAYQAELSEKMEILQKLLEGYNDGRRKSLFCTAVNLLELEDVKGVFSQIAAEAGEGDPVKEKAATAARLFQQMADGRGISLKLNKKKRENGR